MDGVFGKNIKHCNKTLNELFPGQDTITIYETYLLEHEELVPLDEQISKNKEHSQKQSKESTPGYAKSGAIGFAAGLAAAGTILTACGEQGTIAAIITPLAEVHACTWVTAAIGLVACTGVGALIGWLADIQQHQSWAGKVEHNSRDETHWHEFTSVYPNVMYG